MHSKKQAPLMTGVTAGIAVGTAAYLLMKNNRHHRKSAHTFRKQTGKALRTVSSAIENMSYVIE